MVGVGFVGIGLIIGLLVNNLGPAAKSMVQRFGIQLSIIDVGWPASAAIAFGSEIAALIIPAGIVLNLILLWPRITKTINIDIWNFWHFAFLGAIVQSVTGSIWLGLISAMLFAAYALFMADWTAPAVQKMLGIPGISLPHGFSTSFVLPAVIVNKVIDWIPGLNKVEADPEAWKKRFGVFGEPGHSRLGHRPDHRSPRLRRGRRIREVVPASAPGRGLHGSRHGPVAAHGFPAHGRPDSDLGGRSGVPAASRKGPGNLHRARFGDRHRAPDIHRDVAHHGPHHLILAVILPGNHVLPFGDLATIPFMVAMMVPIVRSNVVRATIVSTVVMIPTLYIMNAMAPMQTAVAHASNFAFPEGATQITSICDGGNMISAAITGLSSWNFWIGSAVVLVVLVVVWALFKRNQKAWEKVAGYTEE